MSIQEARPTRATERTTVPVVPRATRDGRDPAIDLARTWCLVVVVLHASMVGISVVDGEHVVGNALEGWDGFAVVTWLVQVMPLFFVLGGASGYLHWQTVERSGGDAADFAAERIRRLLVPATAAGGATVVLLSALTLIGVEGDLVAEAGLRASQPLWFLGVYLVCSCAVPVAAAAHRALPGTTFTLLSAAVAFVDVLRVAGAPPIIGAANLVFVWLLVQQFGFLLSDGTLDRVPRRILLLGAVVALAATVAAAAYGQAPFDLFAALNPPTGVLALLGAAHLLAFAAVRTRLRGPAARPLVARVVAAVNARAMSIYSWHMLVLLCLAGVLLYSGSDLPAPRTTEWWATRPLWILVALVSVMSLVALTGGLERRRVRRLVGGGLVRSRVAAAVLLASAGTVVVLVASGSLFGWCVAVAAWCAALGSIGRGLRATASR